MIIGLLGMLCLFISLWAVSRIKLHIFQGLANIFLILYALSIGDMIFTSLNGILLIVNILQIVKYLKKE